MFLVEQPWCTSKYASHMSSTSLPTFPTLTLLCLSTRIRITSSNSRMATRDFHPDGIQFFLVAGAHARPYEPIPRVISLACRHLMKTLRLFQCPPKASRSNVTPRKNAEVETRQRSASEQPRYTMLANTSTFGISHSVGLASITTISSLDQG